MPVKNTPTVTLDSFRGVNNRDDPLEVGLSAFVGGQNCDITRAGKVKRRPGSAQVYAGTVDAGWFEPDGLRPPVFQAGGALYEIDELYTPRQLTTGLSPVQPGDITGVYVAGKLYLSNRAQVLIIEGNSVHEWGLPQILRQPRLVATSGDLRAGKYQIAVTFQRADGHEGGTGVATGIELPEGSGLTLEDIPTHVDAAIRNIYMTGANGKELRRIHQLGAAGTSWTYRGDGRRFGVPLRTQFKGQPPAGHTVVHHKGRLFVADGQYLYESDPYRPELFDPRNFTPFEHEIQVVAPVQDGLFVTTTDKTVFLAGADSKSFVLADKANYGGFRGTATRIEADHVGKGERQGEAVLWLSPRGICAGFNGGAFTNLTDRYFDLPQSTRGAAAIREADGQIHYLTTVNALS